MPSFRRCAAFPALPSNLPIIDDSRPFYAFFLAKSPLCFIVGHGSAGFRPLTALGAVLRCFARRRPVFPNLMTFPRPAHPPILGRRMRRAARRRADDPGILSDPDFCGRILAHVARQAAKNCGLPASPPSVSPPKKKEPTWRGKPPPKTAPTQASIVIAAPARRPAPGVGASAANRGRSAHTFHRKKLPIMRRPAAWLFSG